MNKLDIISVNATAREGWFCINDEIDLRIYDENDELKCEAMFNDEKYTEEEIQIISNKFLEQIVQSYISKYEGE